MARPINRKLTKAMLVEMGIYNVYWDTENKEWWIDRFWYNCGSNERIHKRVSITLAKCNHKYTEAKVYPKVTFSYNMKTISYPLARFIYAWFKGEVKDGEVVDHINNDPFDNSIDNLRAVSVEENLRKRYQDNPNNNHNQWDAKEKNMQK